MRAPLAVAAALACLAAFPGPAAASTAKIVIGDSCGADVACGKYDGGRPLTIVTYVGAPGEANRVSAARAGETITLSDPGATVTAEAPCRSLDPHTAVCQGGGEAPLELSGFDAQLGDGDDTLAVAPGLRVEASLLGEGGDDALTGGDENDVLDGGPGADRLDGGAGEDVLSFSSRSDGVVVDAASGRTSDGDSFTAFESVLGGAGNDRLLGGPGPDVFRGGPGNDTLRGAGGDDTLSGELGSDSLDGGAGADRLDGDPPQGDGYYTPIIKLRRDILRGGAGNDQLSDTGGANVLAGGSGDDLLRGGVNADRMLGGSGADRLYGGRGADALTGGAGIDRLSSGAGPDRIAARDGLRERIACGSGRDTARVDAKDRVRACEKLRPRRYTSRR